MPEIKTCEQYVLNELFIEQEKNKCLEDRLTDMRYALNEASNENTLLRNQIKIFESEINRLKGIKVEEK